MLNSPVGEIAVFGYYTEEDLNHHMMFLGDITPERLGRLMSVAEEEFERGRNVLFLTENPNSEYLTNIGFLNYMADHDTDEDEINFIVNILNDNELGNNGFIFNTRNITETREKNRILRDLMRIISGPAIALNRLTVAFDNTEAFYAKQWNKGNQSGIDILNIFLKRAKSEGCRVVFAAESNRDIPKEISNNCGTTIVSKTTNRDRALYNSNHVYPKMKNHLEASYGLMGMPADRYFLFNYSSRFTDDARALVDVGGLDQEYANLDHPTYPMALRKTQLASGYNPENPTKFKRDENINYSIQMGFEQDLVDLRESKKTEETGKIGSIPGKMRNTGIRVKRRKIPVMNDNDAGFDIKAAVDIIKEYEFTHAKSFVEIALKVVTAKTNKLNAEMNDQLTTMGLVKKILKDRNLQEAVAVGRSFSRKHSAKTGQKISGAAVAAVYLKLLRQDRNLAKALMSTIDENVMIQLCAGNDSIRSSEAQYRYLLDLVPNIRMPNINNRRAA